MIGSDERMDLLGEGLEMIVSPPLLGNELWARRLSFQFRFSEAGCETKSLREESELLEAGGGRRNEQISQWLEESRFTQEQFVHVQVLL